MLKKSQFDTSSSFPNENCSCLGVEKGCLKRPTDLYLQMKYKSFSILLLCYQSTAQTNVPLVPSILRTFSNRAFGPLLAAWALVGLALSALVSMFPFYIRYVIKPSSLHANPVPEWMKSFVNTTKMRKTFPSTHLGSLQLSHIPPNL